MNACQITSMYFYLLGMTQIPKHTFWAESPHTYEYDPHILFHQLTVPVSYYFFKHALDKVVHATSRSKTVRYFAHQCINGIILG